MIKYNRYIRKENVMGIELVTHDFEPVIDYIQVGGKLSGDTVNADYLQNSNGFVNEKKIQKNVSITNEQI